MDFIQLPPTMFGHYMSVSGYIKTCQEARIMAKTLLDFVVSTSQILFLVMKTLISLELLLRGFVR